jgi:hypothetical protein
MMRIRKGKWKFGMLGESLDVEVKSRAVEAERSE